MITVFALMIYAGQQLQQPVTYWYDINRCKYFASRVMNQPAVPGENKTKYIGSNIFVIMNLEVKPNIREE